MKVINSRVSQGFQPSQRSSSLLASSNAERYCEAASSDAVAVYDAPLVSKSASSQRHHRRRRDEFGRSHVSDHLASVSLGVGSAHSGALRRRRSHLAAPSAAGSSSSSSAAPPPSSSSSLRAASSASASVVEVSDVASQQQRRLEERRAALRKIAEVPSPSRIPKVYWFEMRETFGDSFTSLLCVGRRRSRKGHDKGDDLLAQKLALFRLCRCEWMLVEYPFKEACLLITLERNRDASRLYRELYCERLFNQIKVVHPRCQALWVCQGCRAIHEWLDRPLLTPKQIRAYRESSHDYRSMGVCKQCSRKTKDKVLWAFLVDQGAGDFLGGSVRYHENDRKPFPPPPKVNAAQLRPESHYPGPRADVPLADDDPQHQHHHQPPPHQQRAGLSRAPQRDFRKAEAERADEKRVVGRAGLRVGNSNGSANVGSSIGIGGGIGGVSHSFGPPVIIDGSMGLSSSPYPSLPPENPHRQGLPASMNPARPDALIPEHSLVSPSPPFGPPEFIPLGTVVPRKVLDDQKYPEQPSFDHGVGPSASSSSASSSAASPSPSGVSSAMQAGVPKLLFNERIRPCSDKFTSGVSGDEFKRKTEQYEKQPKPLIIHNIYLRNKCDLRVCLVWDGTIGHTGKSEYSYSEPAAQFIHSPADGKYCGIDHSCQYCENKDDDRVDGDESQSCLIAGEDALRALDESRPTKTNRSVLEELRQHLLNNDPSLKSWEIGSAKNSRKVGDDSFECLLNWPDIPKMIGRGTSKKSAAEDCSKRIVEKLKRSRDLSLVRLIDGIISGDSNICCNGDVADLDYVEVGTPESDNCRMQQRSDPLRYEREAVVNPSRVIYIDPDFEVGVHERSDTLFARMMGDRRDKIKKLTPPMNHSYLRVDKKTGFCHRSIDVRKLPVLMEEKDKEGEEMEQQKKEDEEEKHKEDGVGDKSESKKQNMDRVFWKIVNKLYSRREMERAERARRERWNIRTLEPSVEPPVLSSSSKKGSGARGGRAQARVKDLGHKRRAEKREEHSQQQQQQQHHHHHRGHDAGQESQVSKPVRLAVSDRRSGMIRMKKSQSSIGGGSKVDGRVHSMGDMKSDQRLNHGIQSSVVIKAPRKRGMAEDIRGGRESSEEKKEEEEEKREDDNDDDGRDGDCGGGTRYCIWYDFDGLLNQPLHSEELSTVDEHLKCVCQTYGWMMLNLYSEKCNVTEMQHYILQLFGDPDYLKSMTVRLWGSKDLKSIPPEDRQGLVFVRRWSGHTQRRRERTSLAESLFRNKRFQINRLHWENPVNCQKMLNYALERVHQYSLNES